MSYPPLLSQAFRVCFLLAAVWAALAIPLWLFTYAGMLTIADAYGGVAWHAHELIFGYAALVICGFLFTAIPNWTNRPPVSGRPLMALVMIWIAGRIAMLSAAGIGLVAAAVIDLAFLAAMLAVAGREIVAGRNWRNLRVLAIVFWLLMANAAFHAAALSGAMIDLSLRGAVGALVALITLVGGRLTPSFTRNWLVKRDPTHLPPEFGPLDAM
ncbi:MAG: NnrS family protein, partial [Xanthobacteraceae bacterium]